MKVLLCCAGGLSSSILMKKMKNLHLLHNQINEATVNDNNKPFIFFIFYPLIFIMTKL